MPPDAPATLRVVAPPGWKPPREAIRAVAELLRDLADRPAPASPTTHNHDEAVPGDGREPPR